jgi:MFS transporter, CP family, cyanate transporter
MHPEDFGVLGYRWVNLSAFTALTFMAGAGFLAIAPLLHTIATRWSISFGGASLLLGVFGLSMFLLAIPSGWVAGKVGFKLPITVGASLLALGFFCRGFADSFGAFTLWTILAAVGWGILFSPIGNLVITWFPEREMGLANGMWTVGFMAGQAFGSMTSIPFMVKLGWSTMWIIYGVIAVIIAFVAWFVLKARPPVPPEARPQIKSASMIEGLKQTMNRPNIVLQYTVLATVGTLVESPALFPLLLAEKGVSQAIAGVTSGLVLVGATIGTLVVPPVAFSRQRARTGILICASLAPILFIFSFYAPITGGGPFMVMALALLFGFSAGPVMAISMGIGQMQPGVTPGNAGILAGVFLSCIGLGATVFPAVVGRVVDLIGLLAGVWLLTALTAISFFLLTLFVPEPEAPSHNV